MNKPSFIFFLLFFLTSCSLINPYGNKKVYKVKVGDRFNIYQDDSVSGSILICEELNTDKVKLVKREAVDTNKGRDVHDIRIGAGTKYKYTFEAVKPGTGQVVFSHYYYRYKVHDCSVKTTSMNSFKVEVRN